ncbi:MAG: helix-turn-helix transcriptional regulator [Bacteroidetes bacterium]|nr:helix-turn-helix transcriptional regulator [Bacteroidota bacterium]
MFELEREIDSLRELLNAKDRTIVAARRENDKLHEEIESNYDILSQIRVDLKLLEDIARIDPTSTRRLSVTLQHRLTKIRNSSDIHEVTRQTEEFIEKLQRRAPDLTDAELLVASFLRIGYATSTIAATCCISERTVENHRLHIRRKLGMSSHESLCDYLEQLDDHAAPTTAK